MHSEIFRVEKNALDTNWNLQFVNYCVVEVEYFLGLVVIRLTKIINLVETI